MSSHGIPVACRPQAASMPGMRYSRIRSAAGATCGEAVIPDLLVLSREWMAMGVWWDDYY